MLLNCLCICCFENYISFKFDRFPMTVQMVHNSSRLFQGTRTHVFFFFLKKNYLPSSLITHHSVLYLFLLIYETYFQYRITMTKKVHDVYCAFFQWVLFSKVFISNSFSYSNRPMPLFCSLFISSLLSSTEEESATTSPTSLISSATTKYNSFVIYIY